MDPSPEVGSTFVDTSPVVSWCEMDEATTNSTHLEIRDMPRGLAAMLRETFTHVSSRRLETNALPSPALSSQGRGVSVHAARIMCGELELGLAQDSESDVLQSHAKRVKISATADRASDQEVAELTEDLEPNDIFLQAVELYELGDIETSWKAYRE